jgi:hypothetical protein
MPNPEAGFYIGYVRPGFYPIAAGDLVHAALVPEEELVNGAKVQVRLTGQKGGPGKITITVIVCDDRSNKITGRSGAARF